MKIPPARIVHAKTLQGVLDQQVAIPVFISRDLEERLDEMYSVAMNDTGLDDPLFYCYLDVNNNLMVRLWLIGNQTMWARIDRTIDEYIPLSLAFRTSLTYHPESLKSFGHSSISSSLPPGVSRPSAQVMTKMNSTQTGWSTSCVNTSSGVSPVPHAAVGAKRARTFSTGRRRRNTSCLTFG